MGRGLWHWVESIVYAGLETPSDPLYLSNRTLRQRIKLALLLAIPLLIVGGILAVGWFRGTAGGLPVSAPPPPSGSAYSPPP